MKYEDSDIQELMQAVNRSEFTDTVVVAEDVNGRYNLMVATRGKTFKLPLNEFTSILVRNTEETDYCESDTE